MTKREYKLDIEYLIAEMAKKPKGGDFYMLGAFAITERLEALVEEVFWLTETIKWKLDPQRQEKP